MRNKSAGMIESGGSDHFERNRKPDAGNCSADNKQHSVPRGWKAGNREERRHYAGRERDETNKGHQYSVADRRPDLIVRRLPPAARLAEKQPHTSNCERSGQKNVEGEPGDRRLQIGLVIAIKKRQFL